jgi:hypothetical protein
LEERGWLVREDDSDLRKFPKNISSLWWGNICRDWIKSNIY